MDDANKSALVRLGAEVDRSKAAEKDFVLYFRGEDANKDEPICLLKHGDGVQSIFLQIIPDHLDADQRIEVIK